MFSSLLAGTKWLFKLSAGNATPDLRASERWSDNRCYRLSQGCFSGLAHGCFMSLAGLGPDCLGGLYVRDQKIGAENAPEIGSQSLTQSGGLCTGNSHQAAGPSGLVRPAQSRGQMS